MVIAWAFHSRTSGGPFRPRVRGRSAARGAGGLAPVLAPGPGDLVPRALPGTVIIARAFHSRACGRRSVPTSVATRRPVAPGGLALVLAPGPGGPVPRALPGIPVIARALYSRACGGAVPSPRPWPPRPGAPGAPRLYWPRGPVTRFRGRCQGLRLLHRLSIAVHVGGRSVPTSVATGPGAPRTPRLYGPRGPVARSRGRCPGLLCLHEPSIAVRVGGRCAP